MSESLKLIRFAILKLGLKCDMSSKLKNLSQQKMEWLFSTHTSITIVQWTMSECGWSLLDFLPLGTGMLIIINKKHTCASILPLSMYEIIVS